MHPFFRTLLWFVVVLATYEAGFSIFTGDSTRATANAAMAMATLAVIRRRDYV